MLDLFAIAKQVEPTQEGYDLRFEVDPDVLYPAALAHVVAALGRQRPAEPLGQLWDRGHAIAPDLAEVLAWAKTPRDQFQGADDAAMINARAQLLEVARLWFTELLHQAVGGAPMNVRILKGSGHWRL